MNEAPRRKTAPPESARLGGWVRTYASDLDDIARQSLSDANYRTLDDLERLAGHPDTGRDGRITMDQIMFRIRTLSRQKDAEKRIGDLAAAGFLSREADAIVLRDWCVRQYKSDNSTPRVQEHRAREREHKEVDETLQEALHDTPPQRRGNDPPPVSETAGETPLQNNRDSDRSSSSVGTKPDGRERPPDDDDLFRKLNEAAKGRIAASCRNVGQIRKLLAEGVPLEAVLACFRDNVAHLRRPLQTFGADFIAIEAKAHAEALAQAAARGDAAKAPELVFVPIDAPHWPLVEARYVRERGRQPPRDSRNPDGAKSIGWRFPATWPECASDPLREAAE